MSNKNINTSISFLGDGENREFNFGFNIFKNNHLEVYINEKLQTDGYKVEVNNEAETKGKIIFEIAPLAEDLIFLIRNIPIKRTTDFKEGGPFRALRVNGEFDYQIACLEQLAEKINRAVIKPSYSTKETNLFLPIAEGGKVLVWNKEGNSLENSSIELESIMSEVVRVLDSLERVAGYVDEIEGARGEVTFKADMDLGNLNEVGQGIVDNKANLCLENINSRGMASIRNYSMNENIGGVELSVSLMAQTYVAPADGVINVQIYGFNAVTAFLKFNEIYVINGSNQGSSAPTSFTGQYDVRKGDVIEYKTGYIQPTTPNFIRFYPKKGA